MEIGIDYFTGSMSRLAANAHWPTAVGRLLDGYAKLCKADTVPSASSWQGYQGFRLPSLFWGEREDGAIINASSFAAELAAAHDWPNIRPSRIDLQCTIWLHDQAVNDWIDNVQTRLVQHYGDKPHKTRKIIRMEDNRGGLTLYVGSEDSHRRIRIYNKDRESGDAHYANAVRVELQLRHDMAQRAFAKVEGFNDSWRDTVRGILAAEMASAGYLPIDLREAGAAIAPTVKPRTDNDRRFRWLRAQVRPAIEKMMLDGYGIEEILAALDLV